ncbi:hypothetical protein K438DRAFT_1717960, partial [Mycena galopus ATCC 62051]
RIASLQFLDPQGHEEGPAGDVNLGRLTAGVAVITISQAALVWLHRDSWQPLPARLEGKKFVRGTWGSFENSPPLPFIVIIPSSSSSTFSLRLLLAGLRLGGRQGLSNRLRYCIESLSTSNSKNVPSARLRDGYHSWLNQSINPPSDCNAR